MALSLGKNLLSLDAQRNIQRTSNGQSRALERLASGQRINRTSDDSGSSSLLTSLKTDHRAYAVGVNNINNGISLLNIADEALGQLSSIISRVKELAAQAASSTYTDNQREALDTEAHALSSEYNRILQVTEFNGRPVFDTDSLTIQLQAGVGREALLQARISSPRTADINDIRSLNLSITGGAGDNGAYITSMSYDGRYVLITSDSNNTVAGDANGTGDAILFDRIAGAGEIISLTSTGAQSNGISASGGISRDGRYAVFESIGTNIVAGDTNGVRDTFLRDRVAGTTERISLDSSGGETNGVSYGGMVTDDGRYVVYSTEATDTVGGDSNGAADVIRYDRVLGTNQRVSITALGGQANGESYLTDITPDGRFILFSSSANNIVAGDGNVFNDLFLYDSADGSVSLVSRRTNGTTGNGVALGGTISDDGRYVTFASEATDLVTGDTNSYADIFLYDSADDSVRRVSVSSSGEQGNDVSEGGDISADGRYVAFSSFASNLVNGDSNSAGDAFVLDLQTSELALASSAPGGVILNSSSFYASISPDGRFVGFYSDATNTGFPNSPVFDPYVQANPLMASSVSPLTWFSLATEDDAQDALAWLDQYSSEIDVVRGQVAASTSRFAVSNRHLRTLQENSSLAASKISDSDIATDTAELLKHQLLQNTSIAMYSQANLQPQLVLELLAV